VKCVPYEDMASKEFSRNPISIRDMLESSLIIDEPEIEEAKTPLRPEKFQDLAQLIMR
jgi:hypothetical protein